MKIITGVLAGLAVMYACIGVAWVIGGAQFGVPELACITVLAIGVGIAVSLWWGKAHQQRPLE